MCPNLPIHTNHLASSAIITLYTCQPLLHASTDNIRNLAGQLLPSFMGSVARQPRKRHEAPVAPTATFTASADPRQASGTSRF